MAQLKTDTSIINTADPNAAAIARAVAVLRGQAGAGNRDGDVLRALVIAGAKGHDIGTTLDAVLPFLKTPAEWSKSDRIPLGHALAAAERHGRAASTDLKAAAKMLTAGQQQDGSYGSMLDTWQARSTLIESGMQPDDVWIILIDRWVRGVSAIENVSEAAATLLALDLSGDVMADNLRRSTLGYLRNAQSPSGAWGAAPETPDIFATALATIALAMLNTEPRMARSAFRPEELAEAITKGKAYLVSQQRPDGSWPDAMRPAREDGTRTVSTTAWATLALLS